MVVPKHTRLGERRNPSNYIIAGGSVFIAFVLIAVWVYSAPAAIPDQPGGTTITAVSTVWIYLHATSIFSYVPTN